MSESTRHIVDQLIEERAIRLRQNRILWLWVKRVFYPLLGYDKATHIADQIAPLTGAEAMDWSEDFLSMRVQAQGLDTVPDSGPCVIVANHPGGIADGIALWSVLKQRRPDMVFFANRDAIRVCEGLADQVIPVEWRAGSKSRDKTRETLRMAIDAFRTERCIVIFPAGRMAAWDWRKFRLVEQAWAPTAVSLARKFNAPVIPLGLKQRMSLMFYGLGQIHEELKHMTVFHELLAKRGALYQMKFAEAVDPADLPEDEAGASEALRQMTETLAREAS
ncbi:1-acyl-sn-glycerol-3-phosphate acyltransferase [Maricaulaceae bacterium NA33B04]|nr:1-acyl-sn-glycerol-3-phosphate acyltransferase [Maricaulaceae bacterium NA33B04]